MNGRHLLTAIFMALVLVFFSSRPAEAMKVTVGMNTYYAWWDQAWRNVNGYFSSDPLLMWGPSAMLSFDNGFSVGGVFLQNMTNPAYAHSSVPGSGSAGNYTMYIDTTVTRLELDLTAGYRLFDGYRIFAGFKNMYYNQGGRGDISDDSIAIQGPYSVGEISALYADSYGGGIGLMWYRQVFPALTLSFVVSAVFLDSTVQTNTYVQRVPLMIIDSRTQNYEYHALGGNASVSVSYYFSGAGISASLGGRYQQLKYRALDEGPSLEQDIYYGILASVSYTF